MKTWNQLFIQHGWLLKEEKSNVFDCKNESYDNLDFLLQSLDSANVSYSFENGTLFLPVTPISKQNWLEVLDFENRGIGEGLWFQPGEQPKLRELDTYISGIIRQVNRLGFFTMGSCDGHGRRAAYIMITRDKDIESLMDIFKALGMKRIRCREQRDSYQVSLHMTREELLILAEKLSGIEESWIGNCYDFIKKMQFQHMLHELLLIPGVSGREELVRKYVLEKLTPYVDHLAVDRGGNILAEKKYKSGNGPTILLNAHLDTVFEFESGREIIKNGSQWSSRKGILGADDRAGVAILLHLAEHLSYESTFNGRVKFIFTVEEECGLVGARKVDPYFLWGTDAAIVVDRRGNGDIVTSCGGYIPFCEELYGEFFEHVAAEEGLDGWKAKKGGSSDTRIWAEQGIQSVNLSAGYRNEHTDQELVEVEASYQTARLLKGVFQRTNELRAVLRDIRRGNEMKEII